MEKTGYYAKLLTLVLTDWRNRASLLQTEASKMHSKGLEMTCKAFEQLKETDDIEVIIRSEALTVARERELYGKDDPSVVSSLDAALSDFEVMTSALEVVRHPAQYQRAAATYHSKKKSNGIPMDGFHEAINSHATRLGNRVRAVGISMPEKRILRQRLANIKTAKELYLRLQQQALRLD